MSLHPTSPEMLSTLVVVGGALLAGAWLLYRHGHPYLACALLVLVVLQLLFTILTAFFDWRERRNKTP